VSTVAGHSFRVLFLQTVQPRSGFFSPPAQRRAVFGLGGSARRALLFGGLPGGLGLSRQGAKPPKRRGGNVFELKAGFMQGASASVGVCELGLGGCEVAGVRFVWWGWWRY
jgi:hypothetical protein